MSLTTAEFCLLSLLCTTFNKSVHIFSRTNCAFPQWKTVFFILNLNKRNHDNRKEQLICLYWFINVTKPTNTYIILVAGGILGINIYFYVGFLIKDLVLCNILDIWCNKWIKVCSDFLWHNYFHNHVISIAFFFLNLNYYT